MSEFKEITIKVKLIDNGNAVINNEDGICTEIEDGNDFYKILPLIKQKLANGAETSHDKALHKHFVTACACSVDETTGWTTVKCCNICGRPLKDQNWHWR